MATVRRSATFLDSPESLWATVSDPHHLPRWWPGVQRVEEVDPGSFTQVLEDSKGRTVRVDYSVLEQVSPSRCRWRSKSGGALRRSEVTIELALEDAPTPGTRVTLTLRQTAGLERLGSLRRTGRAELEQALAELGRIHA